MITVVTDVYCNSPKSKDMGKLLGQLSVWNFANDDGSIPTSQGEFRWYPNYVDLKAYTLWCWNRSGAWTIDNKWTLRLYMHGLVMTQ